MEIENLFKGCYKNKKVFITGHTGFKGSWLALWLKRLGAEVFGYSNKIPTNPSHYSLLQLSIQEMQADICDYDSLKKAILTFKPDIIFHLAAQPLVKHSYLDPLNTFKTNTLGTLNLMEILKEFPAACVNVTTDKCYKNDNKEYAFKEGDALGGDDPYSASKACSEIITHAYKTSFENKRIATARAGNVIGGGDWAEDRLLSDIVKAVSKGVRVNIRNPFYTRPWQFVLDSIAAYLTIGESLMKGINISSYNIAPKKSLSVLDVLKEAQKEWDKIEYDIVQSAFKESVTLSLDGSKIRTDLGVFPVFTIQETVRMTIAWYRAFYNENRVLSEEHLHLFIKKAREKQLSWATS